MATAAALLPAHSEPREPPAAPGPLVLARAASELTLAGGEVRECLSCGRFTIATRTALAWRCTRCGHATAAVRPATQIALLGAALDGFTREELLLLCLETVVDLWRSRASRHRDNPALWPKPERRAVVQGLLHAIEGAPLPPREPQRLPASSCTDSSPWPEPSPRKPLTLEARFWSQVDRSGECWTWTAGKVMWFQPHAAEQQAGAKTAHAARWAWFLVHGEWPEGRLQRTCGNGRCVRPEHHASNPEAWFWSKVEKTDTCWIWRGGTDNCGYGNFWVAGRTVKSHRFAYELAHGRLPSWVKLKNRCGNKLCVRPEHWG